MFHCVACDAQLNHIDLKLTKEDGSPEDLCYICRSEVNNIDEPMMKEYLFEGLQEGLTGIKESDY